MDFQKSVVRRFEYNSYIDNTNVRILINDNIAINASDFFANVFHTHFFNEIFVCICGEITIKTNNGAIILKTNEAAIIPSNLPHYKVNSETSDNWFSVGFWVDKTSRKTNCDLYLKLKPLCESESVTVFKNVPEVCKTVFSFSRVPARSCEPLPAIELACVLIKLSELKPKGKAAVSDVKMRMQDIYRFSLLEDILSNRFNEPLTINKLAEALNISSRQLSRIIKARYGITFHKLLVKRRLDSAVNMLVSTDYTVSRILSEVGYTRSSLFYKDFEDEFKITPTEYRKKFLNDNNN